MINWARVEELRNEVGAEAFGEVIELFLEEVDEATERLSANTDRATLSDDLHFLKGAAMNLGFAEFGALCNSNETLAKNGRGAEADLDALVRCYAQSKAQFLDQLEELLAA